MSAAALIDRMRSLLDVLEAQEQALVRNDLAGVQESTRKAAEQLREWERRDLVRLASGEVAPAERAELEALAGRLQQARERTALLLAEGLAYTRFFLGVLTGAGGAAYDDSGRGRMLRSGRPGPMRLNAEG